MVERGGESNEHAVILFLLCSVADRLLLKMGKGTDQNPSVATGDFGELRVFFTADAALELLFHAGFFFLGEMREDRTYGNRKVAIRVKPK